jgi:hypothetical protein
MPEICWSLSSALIARSTELRRKTAFRRMTAQSSELLECPGSIQSAGNTALRAQVEIGRERGRMRRWRRECPFLQVPIKTGVIRFLSMVQYLPSDSWSAHVPLRSSTIRDQFVGQTVHPMSRENVSSIIVTRLLDRPGRYRVSRNLYLQVRSAGAGSWLFRYMRDGRAHWMGLGTTGAFSYRFHIRLTLQCMGTM